MTEDTEQQPPPRMRVGLEDGGQTATLEFLPGSGINGTIRLNAAQLHDLLHALAELRARMPHPQAPAKERLTLEPVINPSWMVRPEAMTEGSLLMFEHPGYGPVSFVLPPPELERLTRALNLHLGMIHPERGAPS